MYSLNILNKCFWNFYNQAYLVKWIQNFHNHLLGIFRWLCLIKISILYSIFFVSYHCHTLVSTRVLLIPGHSHNISGMGFLFTPPNCRICVEIWRSVLGQRGKSDSEKKIKLASSEENSIISYLSLEWWLSRNNWTNEKIYLLGMQNHLFENLRMSRNFTLSTHFTHGVFQFWHAYMKTGHSWILEMLIRHT